MQYRMKCNLLVLLFVSTVLADSGDIQQRPYIRGGVASVDGTPLRNRGLSSPPMPPFPKRELKLDQVKPAVELICSQAVTRAIERDPKTAELVGMHFQLVVRVFAEMATNGNFSAEFVTSEINRLQFPPEIVIDPYVKDVDTLIVTLYRLAYEDRNKAEMPPIEWLTKVSALFRSSINAGLKATGRDGL